ncbi:hypothetical protein LOZ65_006679, partial [Ophidiomyces ophidiicola]
MDPRAHHAFAAAQTDVALADEGLPAAADAVVVLAHLARAVVPVTLGQLEFLQHQVDQAAVVFAGPVRAGVKGVRGDGGGGGGEVLGMGWVGG